MLRTSPFKFFPYPPNQPSMLRYIFLWFLLVLLMACGSQNEESSSDESQGNDLEVLGQEVMTVHDEAMAKMGEIRQLTNKLEARADSLQQAGEAEAAQALEPLIAELEAADQGMKTWMRNYDPSAAAPTAQGAKAYLDEQMEKIRQVNQDMVSSIEQAQQALREEEE